MATTRLMPLHTGKGRSIATALGQSVKYIKNPNKTDNGEWISAYECDPMIADSEFAYSKRQYAELTGRSQGRRNVIAYHLRQSFKPGETDPATANKIGYDLAMSLTKGHHAFIVCTHTDKHHIHSHIIFNSTSLDCTRKFQNFWNSSFVVRRISDQLCLQNGLSVIEAPKSSRGSYGTWLGDDKKPNRRDTLRSLIDAALEQNPADMETFFALLHDAGCEVKQGKMLSVRPPNGERFLRCKSLGEDYTTESILGWISGKLVVSKTKRAIANSVSQKPNLLIDIQAKLHQAHSPGYERWAKLFNLKEMAKTIIYLQENSITDYDALTTVTDKATVNYHNLVDQIRSNTSSMKDVAELQKNIGTYMKNREVYRQYVSGGKKESFFQEHRPAITLCEAAKHYFDSHGYGKGKKKIPKMETLKREYATLASENKKLYSQQKQAKAEMVELLTAKRNADQILGISAAEHEKHHRKERNAAR